MQQHDPIDRAKLLTMLAASKAENHTHMILIVRSTGEYYSVGAPYTNIREQYQLLVRSLPDGDRVVGVYNHQLDHAIQSGLKKPWLWESELSDSFHLDKAMFESFLSWQNDVLEKARQKQMAADTDGKLKHFLRMIDGPYYGSIGGGFTWKITHTSVGTIIKCTEAITGEEIDLTNYDMW